MIVKPFRIPILLTASLFLFAALALSGSSSAARPYYANLLQGETLPRVARATFTTREGLAGNFVTAVAVEKGGTIWVGTTRGLTRLAGNRWTSFTQTHGLGDDWITAIALGPDGRAWFGTESGGIAVFDGKRFTLYNRSNSDLPSNFVTSLAVDVRGSVWVGTLNAGLARYDPTNDHWTRHALPDNSITSLAVDSQGAVWVGTDGGGAFQEQNGRWLRAAIPGSGRITRIEARGPVTVTTADGRFRQESAWTKLGPDEVAAELAQALGINPDALSGYVTDERGRIFVGTPQGLGVLALDPADLPAPPKPLPVVLVHGWTVAESDAFEDSEFRYLKEYAQADGIPVYYARSISPHHTLFQNAAQLRQDIAAVKQTTGADKVNLIAFSMGGLNARAYLESSLYAGDVNRAIILGTPMAGVDIWKPILIQQIVDKPDQPSALELTPEYAELFNATHAPPAGVPYDLLIGDARKQPLLDFIGALPASDGLISVASALALSGPNVRHAVDDDLHAFDPASIPFKLTSYLYPRDTYERYLRNALRDPTNAPLGSEIELQPEADRRSDEPLFTPNHTPVVTGTVGPGQTITRTVALDANRQARFLAYFPGGDVELGLKDPDGKVYSTTDASLAEQALGQDNNGVASIRADIASFAGYAVTNARPGVWSLVLKRTDSGNGPLDVTTYVDLDAGQRLSGRAGGGSKVGKQITINATLARPEAGARVSARIGVPAEKPGGNWTFVNLPLSDNGQGSFANTFIPDRRGYYVISISVDAPGLARETEFVLPVSDDGARLDRSAGVKVGRNAAGRMTAIMIDAGVVANRAGRYALAAALRRPDGTAAARLSTPVELSAGENRVPLTIPAQDLSGPGPYSLDLTLMDATWAAIEMDGAKDVATVQP